eukprot:3799692-Rhodomonas_salina.1
MGWEGGESTLVLGTLPKSKQARQCVALDLWLTAHKLQGTITAAAVRRVRTTLVSAKLMVTGGGDDETTITIYAFPARV